VRRISIVKLACFALGVLTVCGLMPRGHLFAQDGAGSDAAPMSSSSSKAAVQFLFPEQISIAAGKPATAELHFRIVDGLHINSHTPHEKFLIPTNLIVVEPAGVKVVSVDFPPGKDYSFSFSPDDKVSIYSDEFVLHAHLTATRGDHLLQAALRYQACDSDSCFPPKTIPVAIDVIAK
jgi:hypothetical protein